MADELRGWKDIGAHFGASDRTAQRWEREHGMPVHRTGHTRGASVFALPGELDAWRMSPQGVRARNENGHAANGNGAATVDTIGVEAAVATVTTTEAAAGGRFWRSRRNLAALAVTTLLVVAVALAWTVNSRRSSAGAVPGPLSDAHTVPNSSTVFVLKVTTADGTPFVLHVLDGGMATLALAHGPKIGFTPIKSAGAAQLVPVEVAPSPKPGGERIIELKRLFLAPASRVHFNQQGLSLDIEWIESLKSSDLPTPPPDGERKCCIVCGEVTACAAQVSAPPCDGSCCGFGGCRGAK